MIELVAVERELLAAMRDDVVEAMEELEPLPSTWQNLDAVYGLLHLVRRRLCSLLDEESHGQEK